MIVYNVQRRFFDMKADAEKYRVAEGLPPSATLKLEVSDRRQLAALLTELCEPVTSGIRPAAASAGVTPVLVDRAFVDAGRDVPSFLRESWRRFMGPAGLVDEQAGVDELREARP